MEKKTKETKIIQPTKCSYSWKAEDHLLCVIVRRLFNEEHSLTLIQEVGCVCFNAVLVDLISRYYGGGRGGERTWGIRGLLHDVGCSGVSAT